MTAKPWLEDATSTSWLEQLARWDEEFMVGALRCLFHTRLVIPGRMVTSGRRYVADPGQIIPVLDEDREDLLGMTRKQGRTCTGCGGSRWNEPQHYFEEVREA